MVRVGSHRDETILAETTRETKVPTTHWLEVRWKVIVFTGESTVVVTVLEDLGAWAEGPGTLLWLDTLCIVRIIA